MSACSSDIHFVYEIELSTVLVVAEVSCTGQEDILLSNTEFISLFRLTVLKAQVTQTEVGSTKHFSL